MKTSGIYRKAYGARITIESVRFPRARILIESARFHPFGFDRKETGSHSNEDIGNLQKHLSCPDSDREHSVSLFRVRYERDRL